jgi:hypothetical protein
MTGKGKGYSAPRGVKHAARIERFFHGRAATAAARRTGTSNTYIPSDQLTPPGHELALHPLVPMSHSPAPPPQLSNNANNNNTSPSQLAHILSTVLADNESLSKDLATARARYERAEQTLALLRPPATSTSATDDALSPPPSAYPESARRTILDLQSHLEAEKTAREAADARLRTISEAWLDLDHYLQASEIHLSDARSNFSQVLRDASAKPSFNPHPAYQPRRSHQPTPRAPAASQTFPTFSQPLPPSSLPARVRHRDDNTEDAPPSKRLRTDRGTRHSVEVRTCHTLIACSVPRLTLAASPHASVPMHRPHTAPLK